MVDKAIILFDEFAVNLETECLHIFGIEKEKCNIYYKQQTIYYV
jgi:hypothetical protein